jgi:hypothetical protein
MQKLTPAQIFLLLITLSTLAGCTTTVTPPAHVHDPVLVAFTDYGRHTSLVLPVDDRHWVEYATADWTFFALGHNQTLVGVKALLGFSQWTIGRRYLSVAPTDPTFLKTIAAIRAEPFYCDRAYAETLRQTLDAHFKSSREPPYYSNYSKMDQVRGDEPYCLFDNCNHYTADWLRLLGCEVRGPAIRSNFTLARP